ncbi:AmmeMemoRadiSam system protein A [Candidatus Micrarchaeota archaeon]|nr:AmmeMemoRadiSam system protein A [Candidatus Micrarchaeota archaeon]
MMLSSESKKYLLKIARKAINHYLETGEKLQPDPASVPSPDLIGDGACFVTLYYDDKLRGCIGTLKAHRPLVEDVVENALASAFGDPRFTMLTKSEFQGTRISISVLSRPEPLEASGPEELLKKLIPNEHGLIMERGIHRATFLPAVWKEIPDKQEFLRHLSMKAGLFPEAWKEPGVKFRVYTTEEFSE